MHQWHALNRLMLRANTVNFSRMLEFNFGRKYCYHMFGGESKLKLSEVKIYQSQSSSSWCSIHERTIFIHNYNHNTKPKSNNIILVLFLCKNVALLLAVICKLINACNNYKVNHNHKHCVTLCKVLDWSGLTADKWHGHCSLAGNIFYQRIFPQYCVR